MNVFQPRHGEDSYPISRLVLRRTQDLGLTRFEFVARLGYTNSTKGHRVISDVLRSGQVTPFVLKRLATALEIEQSALDDALAALAATARQHEAEEEARRIEAERAYYAAFRPHLRVECERTLPQPIFVAAMIGIGRLRIVPIDLRVWRSRPLTRDRLVKEAILRHSRRQDGKVSTYGRITGYSLVLAPGVRFYDLALPYNIDGNRAGPMRRVSRLGSATTSLKGSRFRLRPCGEYGHSLRVEITE